MVHERITPHFMNITEDKLRGVCDCLCLPVEAHMCCPLNYR